MNVRYKVIATLLAVAFVTVSGIAQAQTLGKSDPAAKTILDAVSAKLSLIHI